MFSKLAQNSVRFAVKISQICPQNLGNPYLITFYDKSFRFQKGQSLVGLAVRAVASTVNGLPYTLAEVVVRLMDTVTTPHLQIQIIKNAKPVECLAVTERN